MRLDPGAWALVHDCREPGHFVFWRGLELCAEVCAERVRPGALWADVGSGTGHLASALAALGARVVGLDSDLRMAHYARRRWSKPEMGPAGALLDRALRGFALSAASCLALADGSCSGVVAISLLGYLAEPAGFFAEVGRVLAPGGTLCLSAMNRHSLLLAASKLWGWRRGRGVPRPLYSAYDPVAVTTALRRAGLVPERQILYGHLAGNGSRVVPSPAAARRRERTVAPGTRSAWARQLLIVARREATTLA